MPCRPGANTGTRPDGVASPWPRRVHVELERAASGVIAPALVHPAIIDVAQAVTGGALGDTDTEVRTHSPVDDLQELLRQLCRGQAAQHDEACARFECPRNGREFPDRARNAKVVSAQLLERTSPECGGRAAL